MVRAKGQQERSGRAAASAPCVWADSRSCILAASPCDLDHRVGRFLRAQSTKSSAVAYKRWTPSRENAVAAKAPRGPDRVRRAERRRCRPQPNASKFSRTNPVSDLLWTLARWVEGESLPRRTPDQAEGAGSTSSTSTPPASFG